MNASQHAEQLWPGHPVIDDTMDPMPVVIEMPEPTADDFDFDVTGEPEMKYQREHQP